MKVVIPENNMGIVIDMNQCLLDIKFSMESILKRWAKHIPHKNDEINGIAYCMAQMMILKLNSFMKIAGDNNQDIETLSAISRGVYEMAFIYHNIFIAPDNEKETEILLLLWKIRGFNNRINSKDPYQTLEQKRRDENEVKYFASKINEILGSLNISEGATRQIQNALKKGTSKITGYRFIKDNGNIVSFEPISFDNTSGLFKNKEKLVLYEMLSSHSHPSYLGIKHFDYMHNVNSSEIDKVKEYLLQSICFCSAKFISDVCLKVNKGDELREEILQRVRFFVDVFNEM